jgi:hypothetical protein
MSPTSASEQSAHTLTSQLLAALAAAKAVTPQEVHASKLELGAPETGAPPAAISLPGSPAVVPSQTPVPAPDSAP